MGYVITGVDARVGAAAARYFDCFPKNGGQCLFDVFLHTGGVGLSLPAAKRSTAIC